VAKVLRINPDRDPATGQLTGAGYRLPAEANLEELAQGISVSMAKGSSLVIEVEMEDDPSGRGRLVLNGGQISSALISESSEPDTA
jgi:hypothetical protein